MKWQDDEGYRIVLDPGSWNFRAATADLTKNYASINRVAQDQKTNKLSIISDTDQFINEVESKYMNSHTKGILTNYLTYNALFDDMFSVLNIENEKRSIKQYSCSFIQNVFEPKRAICNHLEYLFEIAGFGAVRPVKLGEGIFTHSTNYSGILIDLGHSGCSVVPVFSGSIIKNAYRKLDIGGKVLSKCLMDNISTTQLNIHGHFFTANDIKERLCYVHRNSSYNLKKNIKKHTFSEGCYALPDYAIQRKGFITSQQSMEGPLNGVIRLSSERVIIPEALFTPSMYYK